MLNLNILRSPVEMGSVKKEDWWLHLNMLRDHYYLQYKVEMEEFENLDIKDIIDPYDLKYAKDTKNNTRKDALEKSNYLKNGIESDKKYVREMKKRIRENLENRHRRGEITEEQMNEKLETDDLSKTFEVFIMHASDHYLAQGEHLNSLPVSEYDDFFNKLDIVFEHNRDESTPFQGFGADISMSKFWCREKTELLRDNINSGNLASAKYFHQESGDQFSGRITNIPKIIIGLHPNNFSVLTNSWQKIEKMKNEVLSKLKKVNSSPDQIEIKKIELKNEKNFIRYHWTVLSLMEQAIFQFKRISLYCSKKSESESDPQMRARFEEISRIYRDELARYEPIYYATKKERKNFIDENKDTLAWAYKEAEKEMKNFANRDDVGLAIATNTSELFPIA